MVELGLELLLNPVEIAQYTCVLVFRCKYLQQVKTIGKTSSMGVFETRGDFEEFNKDDQPETSKWEKPDRTELNVPTIVTVKKLMARHAERSRTKITSYISFKFWRNHHLNVWRSV